MKNATTWIFNGNDFIFGHYPDFIRDAVNNEKFTNINYNNEKSSIDVLTSNGKTRIEDGDLIFFIDEVTIVVGKQDKGE